MLPLKDFTEHLRLKAKILLIILKALESEKDKIIRAHMLAHIDRIFGLPTASLLGIHLIVNNNYDVFSDKQDITLMKKLDGLGNI